MRGLAYGMVIAGSLFGFFFMAMLIAVAWASRRIGIRPIMVMPLQKGSDRWRHAAVMARKRVGGGLWSFAQVLRLVQKNGGEVSVNGVLEIRSQNGTLMSFMTAHSGNADHMEDLAKQISTGNEHLVGWIDLRVRVQNTNPTGDGDLWHTREMLHELASLRLADLFLGVPSGVKIKIKARVKGVI